MKPELRNWKYIEEKTRKLIIIDSHLNLKISLLYELL